MNRLPSNIRKRVKPDPQTGCWNWTGGLAGPGPRYPNIWDPMLATNVRGNRLFHRWYKGPIPSGLLVCHTCDNPACLNPDHFFLGTHKDNAIDMASKGRGAFQRHPEKAPRGSKVKISKLKEDDVKDILSSSESIRALSKKYGVTYQCVWLVKRGANWKHIEV